MFPARPPQCFEAAGLFKVKQFVHPLAMSHEFIIIYLSFLKLSDVYINALVQVSLLVNKFKAYQASTFFFLVASKSFASHIHEHKARGAEREEDNRGSLF